MTNKHYNGLKLLFCIILQNAISLSAYDGPIKIYNICLNSSDSVATISFSNIYNTCGTFTKIFVKGRVVKPSPDPFDVYETLSSIPASDIKIKQNDLKQREFFIEYLYACNGFDTIRSDTFKVDFTEPNLVPIDSVSVDLGTQKVHIGWSKNTSPDYMGYIIYIRDGVNNVRIQDQNNEGYLHLASNPSSRSVQYTYNTYDTCNNKSLLANHHGTMFLTRKLDFCQKEIALSWSPYIGWVTDNYDIFVSKNGNPYSKLGTTSTSNYTHKEIEPGANYCYFVRSHKTASTFTSSSNRVCQGVPNPAIVSNTHIKSISVISKSQMQINWFTQNGLETIPAKIYRGTAANNLSFVSNISYSNGNNTFIDNIDTDAQGYFYQIIVPDSCSNNSDSSSINKSVFLSIEQSQLEWSSYQFEKEKAFIDIVTKRAGSTWNIIQSQTTSNSQSAIINEDSANCYRVITISNNNDSSYSNTVCILSDLNIYIPSALKSNSNIGNNIFSITGTGIDWSKSKISVYDRWGGKLVEINSANRSWNTKDEPAGTYIYAGYVYGLKGEQVLVKGKITILN